MSDAIQLTANAPRFPVLLVGAPPRHLHAVLADLPAGFHALEAFDPAVLADRLLSRRFGLILLCEHADMVLRDGPFWERLLGSGLPGLMLTRPEHISSSIESVPASWEVLPDSVSPLALRRRIDWYLENLEAIERGRIDTITTLSPSDDHQRHVQDALDVGHISTFEYDLASLRMLRGERRHHSFQREPRDLEEVFEMVHPEDRERARGVIERAAREGSFAQADYRLLGMDGVYRWVRTMGRVLDRTSTHPGRMVGVTLDVDETHRTQEALVQAQERLGVAQRGARLNSWFRHVRTGERHPGSLDMEFYGRELRSLQDFLEIVHPDDRDVVKAWHQDQTDPRCTTHEVEFRVRHGEGAWRWYASFFATSFDESGSAEWVYGVTWDIHARKSQEDSAALARQRLEDALGEGNFLSWEWDLIERRRRFSAGDESVLDGFQPENLDELLVRVHADDHRALRDAMREVMRGGRYRVDFRFWSNTHQAYRWIESRGNGVTDTNAEVRYLRGVSFDITEQVMLAHEATETELRMVEALQAAEMLCWEWDFASGRRRTWGADEAVLGARPETVEDAMDLVHPEDIEAHRAALELGRTTGRYHHEFRIRDSHGHYRWILSRGRPLYNAEGEPVAMRGVSQDITVKRMEEQRIIESERRLQRALTAGRMISWEWDLVSGARRSWGDSMNVVGSEPDRMEAAQELLLPEDREHDEHLIRQAIETGGEYVNEFRVRGRDGGTRWLYSRGSVERDAQGAPSMMQGVALDITDLHETKDALQLSQQRFERVLRSSGMVSWEWSLQHGLISMAGDVEGVFGCHPRTTDEIDALIHPEDRDEDDHRFQRAAEAGSEYNSELRILRPDGQERWLMSRGSRIEDADRDDRRYFGVTWDITERHQQEDALRRNLEWLQLAVIGAGVNTWTLNLADQSRRGGLMDETWYGEAPTSIQQLHKLLEPGEQQKIEDALLVAVDTDSLLREQIRMRRADGAPMTLEVIGRPRYDPSGVAVEVSGVSIDVTDRENDRSRLLSALRRAEEAVAAKARFLASMSHEIRTPLNGVIGVTQLLRGTDLSPRQSELTDTLYSSADQLLGVINDILDFSKLEGGQMRLEQAPFDLAACLAEAQSQVAAQAAQKQLCICNVWDFPSGLRLIGDAQRLRQLLLNLLSNAVKFTDVGRIGLEARYDAEQGELHLLVSDSGIGIPEDVRQHLFQPFWQGDASMTRRFGGTGLGLVICRELANAMGGDIQLLPSDLGSVFEVRLRLACDAELPVPERLNASIVLSAFPEFLRQSLERQLASWGCRTQWLGAFEDIDPTELEAGAIVMTRLPVANAHPVRTSKLREGHRMLLTQPYAMLNLDDDSAPGQALERVRYPVYPHELRAALERLLHQEVHAAPALAVVVEHVDLDASTRILLAEDNEINQYLVLAMLEQLGLDAACVDDGFKAVNACASDRFDVVLMDIEMPLMSGLEATRILRSRHASRPYIIALTAHVLPESRDRMLEVGIDDVLHKPLIIDELRNALRRAQEARLATT